MASEDDADYCPDSSVSPLSDHSSSVNDQGTEPPSNVAATTPQEDNTVPRSENTPQNGLGGISLADIQKGLDFLTAPHHGWDPSSQAMAKCDLCGQAGHRVVYKCAECKLTICKECCETGKLKKDRRHHLDPESVSWEPPPKAKRARARGGNQASGGRRGLKTRGGRVRGRSHTFGRLRSQSPPEATSTIVVDSPLINTSPDRAVTEHGENQGLARRDEEQIDHGDPPSQPQPPMKHDQSLQYHHATAQRLPEGASRLAHPHASSQYQPRVPRPLEPRPMGDHGQAFPQPHLHSNNGNTPLMFPPRPAARDGLMRQGAHNNHRFAPYPLPPDRRRINDPYHNGHMGPPQLPLYGHPSVAPYGVPSGFAPPTPVQPPLMPHNYPRQGSDSLQVNHHQVRYPPQGPNINAGGLSMGNHGRAPTPHAPHHHHHRHHHHHHHHKRPNPAAPCPQHQKQNQLPSVRSLLSEPAPPHTRAPTPQHSALSYRPSPNTRPDVVFPARPQNRGLLHPTPTLAPRLHAPGPPPPGSPATPPVAPPPGAPVAPLGRPPLGVPRTPPVPPADEWGPQAHIEALANRLIQASNSMRNAYPNVALDHCLRHEIDFLWTHYVLPAADVEASFRVLLGATYYAATYLSLDPRQNAAREWLGEKERALIELGYEPIRSMPTKSFLGWERK